MNGQLHVTKTEAHPFHHFGNGRPVFDENCPKCRAEREQERPLLGDTPPGRLSDDDLGGRKALEAAGLEPVDGWDDERKSETGGAA